MKVRKANLLGWNQRNGECFLKEIISNFYFYTKHCLYGAAWFGMVHSTWEVGPIFPNVHLLVK